MIHVRIWQHKQHCSVRSRRKKRILTTKQKPHEKCVEAFYFFNKQKMSKENCLKGAIELWRELKHKKDEFREYIEKHKT